MRYAVKLASSAWLRVDDGATTYYYHRLTGESVWTQPRALARMGQDALSYEDYEERLRLAEIQKEKDAIELEAIRESRARHAGWGDGRSRFSHGDEASQDSLSYSAPGSI